MKLQAKMMKWMISAKPDKNKKANIVFKKDTPQEILNLYEKNFNDMPFPVNKQYYVEK